MSRQMRYRGFYLALDAGELYNVNQVFEEGLAQGVDYDSRAKTVNAITQFRKRNLAGGPDWVAPDGEAFWLGAKWILALKSHEVPPQMKRQCESLLLDLPLVLKRARRKKKKLYAGGLAGGARQGTGGRLGSMEPPRGWFRFLPGVAGMLPLFGRWMMGLLMGVVLGSSSMLMAYLLTRGEEGNPSEAVDQVPVAVALRVTDEARLEQAQALIALGQWARARHLLRKVRAKDRQGQRYVLEGTMALRMGELQRADEKLRQTEVMFPEKKCEIWLLRAELELQRGARDRAEALANQVLATVPAEGERSAEEWGYQGKACGLIARSRMLAQDTEAAVFMAHRAHAAMRLKGSSRDYLRSVADHVLALLLAGKLEMAQSFLDESKRGLGDPDSEPLIQVCEAVVALKYGNHFGYRTKVARLRDKVNDPLLWRLMAEAEKGLKSNETRE